MYTIRVSTIPRSLRSTSLQRASATGRVRTHIPRTGLEARGSDFPGVPAFRSTGGHVLLTTLKSLLVSGLPWLAYPMGHCLLLGPASCLNSSLPHDRLCFAHLISLKGHLLDETLFMTLSKMPISPTLESWPPAFSSSHWKGNIRFLKAYQPGGWSWISGTELVCRSDWRVLSQALLTPWVTQTRCPRLHAMWAQDIGYSSLHPKSPLPLLVFCVHKKDWWAMVSRYKRNLEPSPIPQRATETCRLDIWDLGRNGTMPERDYQVAVLP